MSATGVEPAIFRLRAGCFDQLSYANAQSFALSSLTPNDLGAIRAAPFGVSRAQHTVCRTAAPPLSYEVVFAIDVTYSPGNASALRAKNGKTKKSRFVACSLKDEEDCAISSIRALLAHEQVATSDLARQHTSHWRFLPAICNRLLEALLYVLHDCMDHSNKSIEPCQVSKWLLRWSVRVAGWAAGLEPATSALTKQRSSQLSYAHIPTAGLEPATHCV